MKVKEQIKNNLELKEYNNRLLITGLDSCISRADFYLEIVSYINNLQDDVIFLSLNQKEGPEKWIIDWCRENNYPIIIVDSDTHHTLDDYERANKVCYSSSNILIFTNINEPFKVLLSLAKKHKTTITKIIVGE